MVAIATKFDGRVLMVYSLDDSLGFTANRLANRLKAELEHEFSAQGYEVTAEQWSILSRLNEQEGITQQELGRLLTKDKTNLARMLALLERNRLIERRVDPEDSRARQIYLTDSSRAILPGLITAAQTVLARAQAGFTPDEVRNLIDALNRIYQNLE